MPPPLVIPQLEGLLLTEVTLPGQYIGGELGSIVNPKDSVKGRLCFAFPDVYTIGACYLARSITACNCSMPL